MSTQSQDHDQAPPADTRFTDVKLPANLGEDSFGWVKLCQIANYSGDIVKFDNPCADRKGEIAPGEIEDYYTKAYIPYWNFSKRYEVTYYNQALKEEKKISIKDLDGHWWISFDHDGDDEDIRTISPTHWYNSIANFNLNINGNGYEIYNADTVKLIGRVEFEPAA